jgi:transcriptional regulator with XRE-family HTH domain
METRIKIRLLRIAKGMNQEDLSRLTGIAVYYISAIESDGFARMERRLLDALGYAPEMDALLAVIAAQPAPDAAVTAGA